MKIVQKGQEIKRNGVSNGGSRFGKWCFKSICDLEFKIFEHFSYVVYGLQRSFVKL